MFAFLSPAWNLGPGDSGVIIADKYSPLSSVPDYEDDPDSVAAASKPLKPSSRRLFLSH